MYDRNQFLADNAKTALENNRRAAADRKTAMIREQKGRELKQLETQLFYKKQEVERLQSLFQRLHRELALRTSTATKEKQEVQAQEKLLKDTEGRIEQLDADVTHSLTEIAEKIDKEKAAVFEHQKMLATLEKQKRETESKKESGKRTLKESLSRILFYKKKEEKEEKNAEDLLHANQKESEQIEHSLKAFTQETAVLENKIRSIRSAFK